MAPVALAEPARSTTDFVDLKSKLVDGHVEIEKSPAPPVPDNYMYDFKYNHELPTVDFLGSEIPTSTNAQQEGQAFVDTLAKVWADGDGDGFASLFADFGEL